MLLGIVETRLKLVLIVFSLEERKALITPMEHIINALVVRCRNPLQCLGTCLSKLAKVGQVLRLVLIKLKEVGLVVISTVGVAEIVEMVTKLFFDQFKQLRGIPVLLCISFSGCVL